METVAQRNPTMANQCVAKQVPSARSQQCFTNRSTPRRLGALERATIVICGFLRNQNLPFPALLFDGQLKTRQAPGTSFEPYLILAEPKKIIQASTGSGPSKACLPAEAVNTTTGPRAPQVRFGRLRLLRPALETRATCEAPTAPSVATSSNP
jgi:hypothetical protein